MKPERIKRLFKAYLGIGFLFMLLVCIGIVVFVMSIRGMITYFNKSFISTTIPPSLFNALEVYQFNVLCNISAIM
ncbi:Uncharacterised protein [Klebsiella michiganensis]|uniref:Uncharacterized protein n=1 Tax=Klebsiella michiganensis TaxID=1134687 RepID=A0A7H4PQF8_9ENTR|nr:Uncharacterised protein [Klebsiella michiganensis]